MTICEFFKNQYDRVMTPEVRTQFKQEPGTYEYVHKAWQYMFGGAAVQDMFDAGITHQQIKDTQEAGYLKDSSSSKWEHRGTKHAYRRSLTLKGLKALYKSYKNW